MRKTTGAKAMTIGLIGGLMALAGCGEAPAGPRSAADMDTELQEALDIWAAAPGHKGVSAAVIFPDGREWVSAAGINGEGTSLEPKHLIWIASITKTVPGAVILTLAEEGVLGLDDPISRWLDEIPNIDSEITIRQLLNHTSGVANYTANPALNPAINADSTHIFTAEELIGFVGPKSFERGARTQYTNTAFVLLGMIAEAAAGRPLTELYHGRLWEPLGLNEIFLPGLESPTGPVAHSWLGNTSEQEIEPLEVMSLVTIGSYGFGLHSNARTVARWGQALFTGGVFGDDMRREMLEFVPAAGNIAGESGAGLGIRKYSYLGREQWGHSGGCPLGSSLMLFDPATGVTVAVIMNQGRGAQHFRLAPALLEIATDS